MSSAVDSSPGPSSGMLFFFIATTIYSIVKYNISDNTNNQSMLISTICYIIIIIVGEFIINMNLTTSKCKHQNWSLAFIITVVPWVLMFGIVILMLIIYPGWKAPFSNTFGYGIARLAGSKSVMEQLFPPNKDTSGTGNNSEIAQSLAYIYTDQSILMNEVTVENFDNFWQKTEPIRDTTLSVEKMNDLKSSFRKLIQLKDIVAEYVWYMLTGSLVVAVGYNYLLTASCESTAKQKAAAAREAKKRRREEEANDN